MTYRVLISDAATDEVAFIYKWLYRQSRQGAHRWHDAFDRLIIALETTPERHPLASEATMQAEGVREVHFRTPKGHRYRVLFVIVDDEVRILHVRGPGQAPIQS
jgi:plasmid stabilization system protein ParE